MTKIRNPSLPKDRIKVLLLEGISETAAAAFSASGYSDIVRLKTAADGKDLIELLKDVRIVGIRSRTEITREIVDATDRLMAIGCFSVGTNQVDLGAANAKGIPVFNAPFSNTRSVAELTIADSFLLPNLHFAAFTPEGELALSDAPATRGWLERMRARPSFGKTDIMKR